MASLDRLTRLEISYDKATIMGGNSSVDSTNLRFQQTDLIELLQRIPRLRHLSLCCADNISSADIFICPTYFLLDAFDGRAFKGEFAVPFATHAADIAYYFPSYDYSSLPFCKDSV